MPDSIFPRVNGIYYITSKKQRKNYDKGNFTKAKLSGRISASMQNVFTVSKYRGMDPECGAVDGTMWLRPRTYTIGLNLNF